MFTYPESRPLLNPIPFQIGHTVNPIPVLGAFGSMICLAWSHAAFQGGQGKCRWVGERDPSPQEKFSPGGIQSELPAKPGRLGMNTQLMDRVDVG